MTGTAAARELSRYKAKVCVVEREEDVCCGTSKANSGIVHAGYDAEIGSLKAKLNVRGNERMGNLQKSWIFHFKEAVLSLYAGEMTSFPSFRSFMNGELQMEFKSLSF